MIKVLKLSFPNLYMVPPTSMKRPSFYISTLKDSKFSMGHKCLFVAKICSRNPFISVLVMFFLSRFSVGMIKHE